MYVRSRTYAEMCRILACSALIAMSMIIAGCGASNNMTDAEHVQRAKNFQDKGDLRSALIELKNAAQKNPSNREARWLLGQLYLKFEHGVGAEKELQRAAELGVAREAIMVPLGSALLLQGKRAELLADIVTDSSYDNDTNARIEILRSKAYIGNGDLSKAQEAVDQAVAYAPEQATVKVAQARMQALSGDIDAAKRHVKGTLESHPDSAEAWSFLGDLERWQANYKESEEAYTKAIDSGEYTDTSDRYNRTMVRIAVKNYDAAQKDIKALRELGRNWSGLHYAQGLIHYYQGRYAEAQIAFEKALSLDERHTASSFFLGATHYMQRHWEQADRYLGQALSAQPGLTEARLLLASVRLQARAYGDARKILEPALLARPDDPVLLRLLSTVALREGASAGAIKYSQRLVALQPQSGDAHLQLAQALLAAGKQDEGMAALRKALELSPKLAPAEALLTLNHLRDGDADKALKSAQRLREQHPDSTLALNLVGAAKMRMGDAEGAKKAFQQALDAAPGDVETANNLARLALAEGDAQRTEEVYQSILGKNPGHLFTLLSMAEFEARRGRVEEANRLLRQAVDKHPDALQPRLLLGRFYLRTGAPKNTVALLEAIQVQHRDNPNLLKTLGEAQLAMGRGSQAVDTFQRLVRVWPDSVVPRFLLASAMGATGNWEAMRRGLEQVLREEPDFKDARVAMVRLEALRGSTAKADALLAQLKKDHPEAPDVMGLEGWLRSLNKDFAGSAAAYERAVEKAPRGDWIVSMARAYWLAGDSQRAISRLQEWIDGHPYDIDARYALGSMLFAKQRKQDAAAVYRSILEMDKEQVVALNNLGSLLRESDPSAALSYATRAYQLEPDLMEVRDTYAALLLDHGRGEQALRVLKSLAGDPKASPSVRLHLAQAYAETGNKAAARTELERLIAQEGTFSEREQALKMLSGLKGS